MAINDDARFFDPNRLKDLGDGIFAFSMTFLIITIGIPKVAPGMLRGALLSIIPDITTYVISFFLLAIFWMTNHIQMKNIKSADSRLVWINMLLFLLIVFVPFTTDLYSFYDGSRLSMLVFNLNILLIGLIFMLQWHHLAVNNLHHDEFTAVEVKDRYHLSLTLSGVALLAIVVGIFYPAYSTLVYVIMSFYRLGLR